MSSALHDGVGIRSYQGLSAYAREIIRLAPRAYWRLNEASGLPQDSSGNGRHMTSVSGTPTYGEDGPIDPTNSPLADAILYPSGALHSVSVVSTATDNFTFLAWVKRSGNTAGGAWFQNGSTNTNGWAMDFTNTAGAARVVVWGVGTLGSPFTLANNTYTMIAVQRVSGTWKSYMNGALQNASVGTAAPPTPTSITALESTAASGITWAHAAYFDTALTALDIARLWMISQRTLVTP